MQSEIFQAFICYNFDDYYSLWKLFMNLVISKVIIIKIITNKGFKYVTLHVMSLYNILVLPFKLNEINELFAAYSNFSSFTCI